MSDAGSGIHLMGTNGQRYWVDPSIIEQITELPPDHEFGPKTILYLRYGREIHVVATYNGILEAIAEVAHSALTGSLHRMEERDGPIAPRKPVVSESPPEAPPRAGVPAMDLLEGSGK